MLAQLEHAEVEFLAFVRRRDGRGLDQRKQRIRELLPDREVLRRDGEPAEPEHVTARFGHVPHLQPCDFIDGQSRDPSESYPLRAHGRSRAAQLRARAGPTVSNTSCVRTSKASSCNANVASAIFRRANS